MIGIGWRPQMAADLLACPRVVDLVEVTAESCGSPAARREARALSEIWPVAVHGIKTSLGSAEGPDRDRARKLAEIAREVRAVCVSEHIAFVRAGGVEIGHLTGLPFTREAVAVVARNVRSVRKLLPDVPLCLENVAWSFRWPDDAIDEGDFHREVVEATGCDLLLDVANLYANARNARRDPRDLLSRYPLDRVAMVHVAGGIARDGFYLDTHAHALPDEVFDLAAHVLAVRGDVPVVLERDASFPPFADTSGELHRLGALPRPPARARPPQALVPLEASPAGALAEGQQAMAVLLTSPDPADDEAIARARGILRRKRADEALVLLPAVAAHGEAARALAARSLAGTRRPATWVAASDAMQIAERARADEGATDALRQAARADALVLRARFVADGPVLRRRVAPFVERARGTGGVVRWVVKGFGASARVRVIERRGAA